MLLAHLSDLHVFDGTGVNWTRYLNKRLTGVANLLGPRRGGHSIPILERLVEDLLERGVDHVVVTGDLTNLSLEPEFERARAILAPLLSYERATLVPGNHDTYTRGSAKSRRFEAYFGDVLFRPADAVAYPILKTVEGVHIVGFKSALPRLPFLATGHISSDQLDRFEAFARDRGQEGFTVGLVHHNLHPRSWRKNKMHGMVNRDEVLERTSRAGMDLLLHGHTHAAHRFDHGGMAIIGCGSSTWSTTRPEHVARYNVYHIDEGALRQVEVRVYSHEDDRFHPSAAAARQANEPSGPSGPSDPDVAVA